MERNTRQRIAIREAIEVARRPLLPQEVLDQAQSADEGNREQRVAEKEADGPALHTR